MQSQSNSDNTINNQLQKRVNSDDLEAHQRVGMIPTGIPTSDSVAEKFVNYSTTQSMRVLKPADLKQMAEELAAQANGEATAVATGAATEVVSPDTTAQPTTTDAGTVIADTLIEIAEGTVPAKDTTVPQAETIENAEEIPATDDVTTPQPETEADSKDLAG